MITEWKEAKTEDLLDLIERNYNEGSDTVIEVQLPFSRKVGVWGSKFFGVCRYLPIKTIDKFVFDSIVKDLRNLRDLTASGDPAASEYSYYQTLRLMIELEYPNFVFDCISKDSDEFITNLFLVNTEKDNLKLIYKSPFMTSLEAFFDLCKDTSLLTEEFIERKTELSKSHGSTSTCPWYFKNKKKRVICTILPEKKIDTPTYVMYRLWDSKSFVNLLNDFENENTSRRLKQYVDLFNNSEDFELC